MRFKVLVIHLSVYSLDLKSQLKILSSCAENVASGTTAKPLSHAFA